MERVGELGERSRPLLLDWGVYRTGETGGGLLLNILQDHTESQRVRHLLLSHMSLPGTDHTDHTE